MEPTFLKMYRGLCFRKAWQINVAAVAAGLEPTEIFTKTFLDNFVFIGGCGTLICLLIAPDAIQRPAR